MALFGLDQPGGGVGLDRPGSVWISLDWPNSVWMGLGEGLASIGPVQNTKEWSVIFSEPFHTI